jgi:hypothetical protein
MRSSWGQRFNAAAIALLAFQHRLDPYFRDAFDALFQRPLVALVQALIRLLRPSRETELCQEIPVPGEAEIAAAITAEMAAFMEAQYRGRTAERAGNTKTYGVVRGELRILDDVPGPLRHGLFAAPARYPAWIRFAGPGPLSPPDLEDAGILSIGVKVMGVPGEKLGDERFTQDFLGISCPTFTTPDVVENLKLQRHVRAGSPTLYFFDPRDPHYLDALMQGLYARMNTSPLEVRYWSCVPYLCGEGQAIKYAVRPLSSERTRIPWDPPDDWLRRSMAATLGRRGVELELAVQRQTDPKRMPIEDAGIAWSERRSPFVPVARITIPPQRFDGPEQLAFARRLAITPWHCLPAHRPLGNQNRARRVIYAELSRLRQAMNHEPLVEPDGSEVFDTAPHPTGETRP